MRRKIQEERGPREEEDQGRKRTKGGRRSGRKRTKRERRSWRKTTILKTRWEEDF